MGVTNQLKEIFRLHKKYLTACWLKETYRKNIERLN